MSTESSQTETLFSPSRTTRPPASADELTQIKRALLQAEVRHARARAAVSGAEADVKVLTARLKALTK